MLLHRDVVLCRRRVDTGSPDCTGDTAMKLRIYQNLWSGDAMWYAEFGQYYGRGETRESAIVSLKIRLNQIRMRGVL